MMDEAERLAGKLIEQAAASDQEGLSVVAEQVGAVALEAVHAHLPPAGFSGGDEEIQVGVNQRANGAKDVAVRIEIEGSLGGLVAAQPFARERRIKDGLPMLQIIGGNKAEMAFCLLLVGSVAGIDAHIDGVPERFHVPKTGLRSGDGLRRAPTLRL